MLRSASALICIVLFAAPTVAEEIAGTFVKYDKEKKVLVLKIDEKEKSFQLDEETKLFTLKGEPSKRGIGGLGAFKKARPFKLKTEKKGDKLIVIEVRPQP